MHSPEYDSPAVPPAPAGASDASATFEERERRPADEAPEVVAARHRVRTLLLANQSVVGELSLPLVLRRLVEAAASVSRARYAALGVLGPGGLLEQFVHTGMDDAAVAAIGHLPEGRGVLGAVIDDHGPIRLDRIAADPRSSGFPPGHPPMTRFLGVPVRCRGVVYGNLYLTDPQHGQTFTEEDVELVTALAATAGIAIENARLYEESERRQRWLQASTEVTRKLLAGTGHELAVLDQLVVSVQQLTASDVVTLVLPAEESDELEVAVATGLRAEELLGLRFAADHSLSLQVMENGHGMLLDGAEVDERQLHLGDVIPLGAVMALPLTGDWGSRGAILVGRTAARAPFNAADLEMAEAFAEQAALALELAEARSDQQRLTVLEDRDRIGRDLHDHVIQRLFASGLGAQALVEQSSDPAMRAGLTRTIDELTSTIRQIRSTIVALRDPSSATASVRRAVGLLVSELALVLGFRPETHLSGPLDTLTDADMLRDVEAVLRESLTNLSRHARASAAWVRVEVDGTRLSVVVRDNGVGLGGRGSDGARTGRWSGLANLRTRAEQHHGSLTLDEPPEGGLRLRWSIPIRL